jgi:hypothetical protein
MAQEELRRGRRAGALLERALGEREQALEPPEDRRETSHAERL